MEVISNILAHKKRIMDAIAKFGYSPDHNFWYFMNLETKGEKCIYFNFQNQGGIMAQLNKDKSCTMVSDVIAPDENRLEFFGKFMDFALNDMGVKKVFVILNSGFRKEVMSMCKNKYHLSRQRTYYCPVYNLKEISKGMEGSIWKKLRNIRNRFYREHDVGFARPGEVDKEALKNIIMQWKENRSSGGRSYHKAYLKFIENNFNGTDSARILTVNGIPSAVTAGWRIPNSNNYYSAIGIYSYKFKFLGEIANLDDLVNLHGLGYDYADFGNSDSALLSFKKKFNPEYVYDVHYFSIRNL